MNRSQKRDRILECIIVEYIRNPEPIGSEHIKELMGIDISSATIRNHLKAMSDDGLLVQLHISGGRTPSEIALQSFWSDRLSQLESIEIRDVESLQESANRHNVSSVVKIKKKNKLLNVYSAGGKYIVAEFDEGEITIKGDEYLSRFLGEFVGLDIMEIRIVAQNSRVDDVVVKIDEFSSKGAPKIANEIGFFEVATTNREWGRSFFRDFLTGSFISGIENGVHFGRLLPNGYLMFKSEAHIGSKDADFVCFGHVTRNFEKFIEDLN
jgi:heat-inducible transcriptional repressor